MHFKLLLLAIIVIAVDLLASPAEIQVSTLPYKIFKDQEEAIAVMSTQERDVINYGIEYQTAREIIAVVWKEAQKLYPELVGAVPAPFPVITDRGNLSASAEYAPGREGIALVVMADRSLFKFPREAVTGVFAHEIAHLVFKHVDYRNRGIIYAYEKSKGVPLDSFHENNMAAFNAHFEIFEATQMIGVLGLEMPGPYAIGNAFFADLVTFLMLQKKDNQEACSRAVSFALTPSSYSEALNRSLNTLVFTSTQRQQLATRISKFNEAFRQCAPMHMSFEDLVKLYKSATGQKPFKETITIPQVKAVFDRPHSIGENLIEGIRVYQELYKKLDAEVDFDRYISFTIEDHADQIAVQLLVSLGIDVRPSGSFYRDTKMKNSSEINACFAKIRNNEAPYHGLPGHHYHSPCYRIYQIKQWRDHYYRKYK